MSKMFFANRLIFWGIIFLVGILLSGCKNDEDGRIKSESPKPNIIYILADDLGYGDLSCYGQQNFQTPNIDKLASEGIRFTQHYSGSTVCAPSRSSLMTGLHTGKTFIRGNKGVKPEGQYPIPSSIVTFAELLKDAGYKTGAFGKWGLGPPGSEGDPNMQGFDKFYGYNCQTLAHNYYPYHLWNNQSKVILDKNSERLTGIYGPEIIHNNALQFIEENKDTTFFLFYPSVIPHAELFAPEKYIAKFRGKYLPEKKYEGTDAGKRYKRGGYGSQNESHAAFVAMVTILDEQVGEITAKLKELGIADNTLIIFTSDNGPHKEGGADPDYFDSNGKLRGYKRDLYEGGIRVPMIATWPGKIAPQAISNHISAFWDVLPTMCDIAKIERPKNIDGISFLPELLGEKQILHEYLYWEFHEQNGKQAVRFGNWKGVRLNMHANPDAPIELFDLSKDMGEQKNVAFDNPKMVEKISSIMKNEHTYSKEFSYKYEQETIAE